MVILFVCVSYVLYNNMKNIIISILCSKINEKQITKLANKYYTTFSFESVHSALHSNRYESSYHKPN